MPSSESHVILDWQPHLIRAGIGVHEVIRRPTHELVARVGLRLPRTSNEPPTVSEYLVGAALDEALKSGEQIEIIWPFVTAVDDTYTNGDIVSQSKIPRKKGGCKCTPGVVDWTGLEALFQHVLYALLALPSRPINHYIAVSIPWPINVQSREKLSQLFFEQLNVPALLFIDRSVSQLYGTDHSSGLVVEIGRQHTSISCVPDSSSNYVFHISSPIGFSDLDNYMVHLLLTANPTLPQMISGPNKLSESEIYSALLRVVESVRNIQGAITFSSSLLQLGIFNDNATSKEDDEEIEDVAKLAASGQLEKYTSRAQQPADGEEGGPAFDPKAPIIQVPHPLSNTLPEIPIGLERHRYAEPLFEPTLLENLPCKVVYTTNNNENEKNENGDEPNGMAVDQELKQQGVLQRYSLLDIEKKAFTPIEATCSAVKALDPDKRPTAWENFLFTGELSLIPGIQEAFVESASRFLIDPESGSDSQPRHIRPLKVPDYFAEYKQPNNRPDLLGYLGTSIMAKICFADNSGKSYMTKADYNTKGPTIATQRES